MCIDYLLQFVKIVAYIVLRFVFQPCIVKKVQPTTITSMVITIHFFHPVVNVSTQNCAITPQNPTTLTPTGGVLVSGITDV